MDNINYINNLLVFYDRRAKQTYLFSVTFCSSLTLWPWSWKFRVYHTIYVKCEYFMNQEG